jgi:cytochrome b
MIKKINSILTSRVFKLTTLISVIQIAAIIFCRTAEQRDVIIATTSAWLAWTDK